eukprot:m.432377 g.432377  ORF g.432377 m.432377 type:complete len:393 (-) comp20244_c0_seq40:12-1190(-)
MALFHGVGSDSSNDEDDHFQITKILYCSRTHSQLAQLVHEVKACSFGSELRVVSLGSRQNLCVNERVNKLKSLSLINEKCMDLQKAKKDATGTTRKKKGCPYLDVKTLGLFRDHMLMKPRDIEDLADLGSKVKGCAYYGSRQGIPLAELVLMPYNVLLHKGTREAVGVKLKGNVVIVDEAHNLLDVISSLYSAEVSGAVIQRAFQQLTEYAQRYQNRLKAKNLVYINQTLKVLKLLLDHLQGLVGRKEADRVDTVGDFVLKVRIDNINLFKLRAFLEQSEISKKLNGFVLKHDTTPSVTSTSTEPQEFVSRHVSALRMFESFLQALTNADDDGRILSTIVSGRFVIRVDVGQKEVGGVPVGLWLFGCFRSGFLTKTPCRLSLFGWLTRLADS